MIKGKMAGKSGCNKTLEQVALLLLFPKHIAIVCGDINCSNICIIVSFGEYCKNIFSQNIIFHSNQLLDFHQFEFLGLITREKF